MRSKEKELNFTDYEQLNCYRYIEDNDTIEEPFYQTNDSKLCKYFTCCYYFNIYLFISLFYIFFKLKNLRHSLGVILLNTSQVKRILKFKILQVFENDFFLCQFNQLQKGILSMKTYKHIKDVRAKIF